MAKIQLKSDDINPFGGLFSILNIFNRSGLRSVIDRHLGRRGMTKAAFTHGDVMYTMMDCCKLAGVNVEAWLTYFLDYVHDYDTDNILDVTDLLPSSLASRGLLKTSESLRNNAVLFLI